MLVEYIATEMGFLDDYSDADSNYKNIRGNGITTFLLHVAQCIIFNQNNIISDCQARVSSSSEGCSTLQNKFKVEAY